MLTADDFGKLKKIIRDEVEAEGKNTRDELSHEILRTKMELSNDIASLGSRVKNVEIGVNNLQKDTTIIKKDVKRLRKDVDGTIRMADRGLLNTQKRVRKIETHLGFPEVDFA